MFSYDELCFAGVFFEMLSRNLCLMGFDVNQLLGFKRQEGKNPTR